jgi:hypothetical protein
MQLTPQDSSLPKLNRSWFGEESFRSNIIPRILANQNHGARFKYFSSASFATYRFPIGT